MRILGIDPGTRIVGYGVIDKENDKLKIVNGGIIRVDSSGKVLAKRLKVIYLLQVLYLLVAKPLQV